MSIKYNDQVIIEAFKKGSNRDALKFLYKRSFPKIKAYVLSNSGSQEDALDIFQDAVLALCKQIKMKKFNEKYELDGFLFSVSRNLWINKVKKENRQVSLEDENKAHSFEPDFSNDIITPERERIVKAVLEKLGKKCVELLQFSVFHRLSNKEIMLKMPFTSEDAIKTQKYKCKQKLIGIMDKYPTIKELID